MTNRDKERLAALRLEATTKYVTFRKESTRTKSFRTQSSS